MKKSKEAESTHQSKTTLGTYGEGNISIAEYTLNEGQQQNISKDKKQKECC